MACLRKSLIATVAYFCFSTEFQFPLSKMVEKLPVCIEQCPPPPHKIHVLSGPQNMAFFGNGVYAEKIVRMSLYWG